MTGAGELRTARLALRPVDAGDTRAILMLHADPRVSERLVDGIPSTLAGVDAFLRWNAPLKARNMGTFAVRRHGAANVLGLFSLTPFADGDSDGLLELGGKLFPGAWHGDLSLEAGAAMIGHGFAALGRDRLVSAYHPDNRSARFALLRLGFGDVQSRTVFDRPATVVTLTRADWLAQGGRARPAREIAAAS